MSSWHSSSIAQTIAQAVLAGHANLDFDLSFALVSINCSRTKSEWLEIKLCLHWTFKTNSFSSQLQHQYQYQSKYFNLNWKPVLFLPQAKYLELWPRERKKEPISPLNYQASLGFDSFFDGKSKRLTPISLYKPAFVFPFTQMTPLLRIYCNWIAFLPSREL